MGAWARAAKFKIEMPAIDTYFDRVLSRPARQRAQAKGAK
jgi:glutathione S-transferase